MYTALARRERLVFTSEGFAGRDEHTQLLLGGEFVDLFDELG